MKKIILAALMAVMIVTPCFAQEVEPEGIFSIEGTEWQALPIELQIFPFPWIWKGLDFQLGFYGGDVYPPVSPTSSYNSFYMDMLVCSIFTYEETGGWNSEKAFGIMQPIGMGMMMRYNTLCTEHGCGIPSITMRGLVKTEDDWKPPEFVSISPNQREQGTTLTNVTIIGANTDFEPDEFMIVFDSIYTSGSIFSDSNINVISNTEIKFDLAISEFAPIGFYDVSVFWNGKSATGHDVFEVLPKTN